jgi:hypothetical protein
LISVVADIIASVMENSTDPNGAGTPWGFGFAVVVPVAAPVLRARISALKSSTPAPAPQSSVSERLFIGHSLLGGQCLRRCCSAEVHYGSIANVLQARYGLGEKAGVYVGAESM